MRYDVNEAAVYELCLKGIGRKGRDMGTSLAKTKWSRWLLLAVGVGVLACCGPALALLVNEPGNNDFSGRETIAPPGPGTISDSLTGSPAPGGVAFGQFGPNPPDTLLGPPAVIKGVYGHQVVVIGGAVNADGTIRLRVSGFSDEDFDGDHDVSGLPHSESGSFNVHVDAYVPGPGGYSIWSDPCVIGATLTPGNVVLIELGGLTAPPGLQFDAWIDNLLPSSDPTDYVVFANPADPCAAGYMAIGVPFDADMLGAGFDSVIGWFEENGDPCIIELTPPIPPIPPLPLLQGWVPGNGRINLGVTGNPPGAGLTAFDGFHVGSGPYTLDLSVDTSGGTVYDLFTRVGSGNGTINPSGHAGRYYAGSAPGDPCQIVALQANPASHWQVLRWTNTDDDLSRANVNTVTVARNTTVTVDFECIPRLLVTEVIGSGGTLLPTTAEQCEATIVALTAKPNAGWQVKAWTGIDPGSDVADPCKAAVTMDTDGTVTVEFECIPRQLTTSVAGDGGLLNPASGPHCQGETVDLVATVSAGWQVDIWEGVDSVDPVDPTKATVAMNSDRDVVVTFVPSQFELTTAVVGNGDLTPTSGTQAAGAVVDLLATPDAGWRFDSWDGTDDDTSIDAENTVTMTEDKSVTAEFVEVPPSPIISTYLLEDVTPLGALGVVNRNPAGEPNAPYFEYVPDTVVALTAVPQGGNKVASWIGTDNPASTALTNQVTMTGPNEVIEMGATFVADPNAAVLTTSVVGGVGGTITDPADPCTIRYTGEVVQITAAPATGWVIVGWTGATVDPADPTKATVLMDSDKDVTVEFEQLVTGDLTVTKMKVKADKDRDAVTGQRDSFKFEGAFDGGAEADLTSSDTVVVTVGSNSWPVPYSSELWKQKGNKYTYKDKIGKDDRGISKIEIEFTNSGTCKVDGKNVSLAGVNAPATVGLAFGAFDGSDAVGEDIINGEKKPIPICLMSGVADDLEPGKAPKVTDSSLNVSGGIASDAAVNLTADPVTVSWAGQSFELPAGSFEQKADKWTAKVVTISGEVDVTLDFDKCTFSVKVKDASGLADSGELGISFTGFDESKTWNGTAWVD